MAAIKLSIIIVNYNNPKLIEKCLASIAESNITFPYEIIVVDNGSDYSVRYQVSGIRNKFEDLNISLIENKENLGFGRANNQGVKKARGEYVLFLNTDIEVLDKSVEKLLMFADTLKEPAIIGGKLLNPDHTDQPSCGPFYTLPVAFAMLFLKGDTVGLTRSSPDKTKEADWVSGACILMKKVLFQDIGGFDETIFMYMEEIDLCYRAKKKGVRVVFYPDARFIHLGAATSRSRSEPVVNIYRGLQYFYKTHFNPVQYKVLRLMLVSKAWAGILVGTLMRNQYLTATYTRALAVL